MKELTAKIKLKRELTHKQDSYNLEKKRLTGAYKIYKIMKDAKAQVGKIKKQNKHFVNQELFNVLNDFEDYKKRLLKAEKEIRLLKKEVKESSYIVSMFEKGCLFSSAQAESKRKNHLSRLQKYEESNALRCRNGTGCGNGTKSDG